MGIDLFYTYDFRIGRFLFLVIISLSALIIFSKHKSILDKLSLFVLLALIFIYSGFGAGFSIVPDLYILYYVIYIFFFLYAFSKVAFLDFIPNKYKYQFETIIYNKIFSTKNSKIIIYIFLLLSLLNSLYPNFNVMNLFIIKKPELIFDISKIQQRDLIQNMFFYVLLLLQPFYLLGLSIYKKKPIKLLLALWMPIYFTYALGGYTARSTLVPYFVMFIAIVYLYNKKYRRIILWGALFLTIPILVFLYNYSLWRSGGAVSDISTKNAILSLFAQEVCYPIHFKTLFETSYSFETISFFKWLITLPLPQFLKDPSFSIYINYEITEILTGQSRLSPNFSVVLPGVVTESYYIFGKYFIFIMPLITGWIMGFLYKLISSSTRFIVLQIYFILMLFPLLARGGGAAALSIVINQFLLFYLIMFWIRRLLVQPSPLAFDSCCIKNSASR